MLKIEQIRREIQEAFKGVVLGDGVSLYDAEIMDNYGKLPKEKDPFTEKMRHNWGVIPAEVLTRFCAISHLDSEGFRFFSPSFMLHDLNQYEQFGKDADGPIFSYICPRSNNDEISDYVLSQFFLLNYKQKHAIFLFCDFFANEAEIYDYDKSDFKKAISAYWNAYS